MSVDILCRMLNFNHLVLPDRYPLNLAWFFTLILQVRFLWIWFLSSLLSHTHDCFSDIADHITICYYDSLCWVCLFGDRFVSLYRDRLFFVFEACMCPECRTCGREWHYYQTIVKHEIKSLDLYHFTDFIKKKFCCIFCYSPFLFFLILFLSLHHRQQCNKRYSCHTIINLQFQHFCSETCLLIWLHTPAV